jgi:hypothetical protein
MRSMCLVSLLAGLACAWTPPSGGLRSTNVNDMLFSKRGTRYYNEAWSYQFQFDNGLQASLNMTYAKLGFKDPVCGADLSLAGFKGRNYTVGREYPAERFQQSANPFRIAVNENIWMTGMPPAAHRLHFVAAKNEGFFVDLVFTDIKPGVVWGDGRFQAGDGDFSVALPIPMANVSGRIAVGGDTISVKGVAMMEHLRQSHLVSDLLTSSMRFFHPGPNPMYVHWFKEAKKPWGGFAVNWASGQPVLLTGNANVDGQVPPAAAVLQATNGTKLDFSRKTLAQASSILDGMEGVTRTVVKMFIGNVKMYRGKGEVNGQPGIYQFMKIGS